MSEHETCNCHDCTQARYRTSLLGQIDAAMKSGMRIANCPRCGLGIDDDGDGNCGICQGLSDAQVRGMIRKG